MKRRNTLYTVNRWNTPLLCSGGRLFANGGKWDILVAADREANPWNYTMDGGSTTEQYMNSKNSFGLSKANNPFSKGNIKSTLGGLASGAASGVGSLLNKGISGGYSSGAGSAISNIGGMAAGVLGTVNPLLGAAVGVGSQIIRGVTNALFGTKTNQKALNQANAAIQAGKGFTSTANDFDDVTGPTAQRNFTKVYSGGAFKKGWARKKNAALKVEVADATSFADRSVTNNVQNIADDQMGNALVSYAAYGGPLTMIDNDMGAIEYGMMSDYLTVKNKQVENKNNMVGYLGNTGFGNSNSLFALGGDMQSNGADWSTGLGHIAAGGSHEENPYEGVPMGIAPDGQPNLVEEGETIYNDYVFSDRIKPTKEVLKKFHLSTKNSKLTYADVSKKLEKESQERPNDPISRAGLHKLLDQLAEAQEQQKAQEAAMEAQEAFAALSPEEQQQVMAQIAAQAQQEQLAQQQAVFDQQQAARQEVPIAEDGNLVDPPMIEQGYAYGGKAHRFDDGGKAAYANTFNRHTAQEWNDWAAKNGLEDFDFDAISDLYQYAKDNPAFVTALGKDNPIIADAISRGYDFGVYVPTSSGYDLEGFNNEVLGKYNKSKIKGRTNGNYAIDQEFGIGDYNSMKDYEASPKYVAYTNALQDVAKAANGQRFVLNNGVLENVDGSTFSPDRLQLLNTLYRTAQGTATYDKGNPVPLFAANDDGTYSIASDATTIIDRLRNDQKGGIFHLNPKAISRSEKVTNYIKNADGSIVPLIGDTSGYKSIGSYTWNTPENRIQANYFEALSDGADIDVSTENENGSGNGTGTGRQIPYKDDRLRYAGIFGPAVGLGLWAAGVGKPDTSGLDAAMSYARNSNGRATYRPIGNYLRYEPMDVWAEQNRLDANTNATNRAILNTGSTAGGKMAGLLASGYASQLGSADLYRKAREYNDAQRQKVAEFNRGTDMFNAEAFNKTSQTNAELANRNAQFQANLAADIARQKMAANSQWYQGLYGNLGNLATSLANLGRENAQHNMIAAVANDGGFGTIGANAGHYSGSKKDLIEEERKQQVKKANNGTVSASHGGKLKKRKGFTF